MRTVGGLLVVLFCLVLGWVLLQDAESAMGVVGASLFLVCGVIVLGSFVATQPYWRRRPPPPVRQVLLDGEQASFHPRRTGFPTAMTFLTLSLLGGWFAALGIVGSVESVGLWGVLAVGPAVYFLAFVVFWLAGRFRAAGVWLTPTRLVNEHYGIRSEVALDDLLAMSATGARVVLVPADGVAVRHRPLVPRPWRHKLWPGTLLPIDATDLAGGGDALTASLAHLTRPFD